MSKTQYGNGLSNVGFTICLEAGNGAPGEFPEFKSEMHNQVHNWVGGTMADISTAAADPIGYRIIYDTL
jgi:Common central domain of tyrosinase